MAALVVAGAATGALPARADAAGCRGAAPCVVVEILDAGRTPVTRVVELSDLVADQPTRFYRVRDKDGRELASENYGPGTSIDELFNEAGLSPAAVTFAHVVNPGGQVSTLKGSDTPSDFGQPPDNDFLDGLSPIFYASGEVGQQQLGYVRPLRIDGQDHTTFDPTDHNADELMQINTGALTVKVSLSGTLLNPTLSTNKATVDVGQSVLLSGAVRDPPHGETLTWALDPAFSNGTPVTGPNPTLQTRSFTAAGTFYVRAGVTGSNGSSGESNTVVITVKARHKVPSPKTTGPGRGAGSSKNPIAGPVTGSGSRYNGRPGAPPSATGGPAVPSANDSRTEPASVPPGSATGSATAKPSASGSSPVARRSGGELVAGFALIDPAGASSASSSVAAAPAAAAPAARAGGQHVRASLAWVGVACILALLLAGAGLERRRSFPGRSHGRERWRHR